MEAEKALTGALGRLKVGRAKSRGGKRQLAEIEQNLEFVETFKEKKVLQWYCNGCKKPCLQIREESRCICGHRLKYHDTKGKRKCCENRCPCKGFFYIVAEGSWTLRCQCKHKSIDHDPNTHACKKPNCSCTKFKSPWVCNCNCPWSMHEQVEATVMVKTISVNNNEFVQREDVNEVNPWQDLKRGLA
ncbi:hypothetical protein HKI87_02g13090 [Chloropicon roscoffensis]|uniref:Protein FAM221A n=1 Tax=Chloropicon roscoffensis TaxID=1461544 RepID=A0AAX4P0R3_9CHLO